MNHKEKYKARLAELKPRLPKYYGVVFTTKFPSVSLDTVYGVVNKGNYNEDVLEMLEKTFPKIKPKVVVS